MQYKFKNILCKYNFWYNVSFICALLYLSTMVMWLVIVALFNGTDVNTYAANGTFQLYNPLRRLEMGQTIGRDFPFFHGVGVLLLHYPIYWVLGGGLFAVETAKWIVSPFMFLGSSFVFFYAYNRSFKKSIIATSMITIITLFAINVFWPGNSLYGVRSTFPVLIMASLIWETKRSISLPGKLVLRVNELVALILLGISPIFGSEHGVAAIGAYLLIQVFIVFQGRKHTSLIQQSGYLLYKFFIICLVSLLTYTLLTKGNPVDAIRYAFIDIPSDQGWYFGADPAIFLTWETLLPGLFNHYMLYTWVTLIAGALCYLFIIKTSKQKNLINLLGFGVLYGSILFGATIGGYYAPATQLLGLQRILALVIVAVVVTMIFNEKTWHRFLINNYHIGPLRLTHTLPIACVVLFVFMPTLIVFDKISQINRFQTLTLIKRAHQAQTQDDYFVAGLGWKASVDKFRTHIDPTKKIWSTYTGIYDSMFGNQLNSSSGGEDYIIHALGNSRREKYEYEFLKSKPYYVITLKPNYFVFEEWLWHNHWNIYEDIFSNYSLISENNTHYLWQKNQSLAKTSEEKPKTQNAQVANNSFTLPPNNTDKPIVYTVHITYKAQNAPPLTSRFSRYLITIDTEPKAQQHRISLPSSKTSWDFPVIIMPHGGPAKLNASTEGVMPLSNIVINSASFRLSPIEEKNLAPLLNNACYILEKSKSIDGDPESCNQNSDKIKWSQ